MRNLLSILLSTLAINSFAYTTINLNNSTYKCSNTVINATTTESEIRVNCKNASEKITEDVKDGHNSTHISGGGADQIQDDDESVTDNQYDTWSFTNDDNQHMKCYFKNKNLIKCKVNN